MTLAVPAPTLAIHQLSLYNAGRMSPEQVVAAFAARMQQFERIVADLAAEKPRSRAQHHLIVGQRGMGKTMLLARIAAELRVNTALSASFIPLVFAEEQYAVDRLSKFWLNCLDSLADARELSKDTQAVEAIDATVARLTATRLGAPKDDQQLANDTYEAFAHAVKSSGQRAVLLVDNLQLVFERLSQGEQHSLRELLMRPGSPIVIGASPSPPPATADYGAAFYDHFKVHYLRPLEEPEMRELMLHLAEAAGRDDVRQRVLEHPARLTVLRQLTGGNPRTVLTLFFLYAEDFAPNVFGDLEGLLDRVTPLYKARFEELTPQQQVIASAIANHWDPVTASALAVSTGLPAGTISAQLDRLEKTGTVERTELFGETSTGYQLAERFFNIWFLMRSASRRQRREVEFLTRFLESFYEPADRARLARRLMEEDHFTPDRYAWSQAVAASLDEREFAEELSRHVELAALRDAAREAHSRLHELMDFEKLSSATLVFADLREKLMSLVPTDASISADAFAQSVLGDRALFTSEERKQFATIEGPLTLTEIQRLIEAIDKARAADVEKYSAAAVAWFSQRLATGQMRALQDAEDWNRAFHQADGKETIQLLVDSLPNGFGTYLSDSSLAIIKAAIQPAAEVELSRWFHWATVLHEKLGQNHEAQIAYGEVIARLSKELITLKARADRLPDSPQSSVEDSTAYGKRRTADRAHEKIYRDVSALAWVGLGSLYSGNSARYADAERAFLEALVNAPELTVAWNLLGNLYCDHLHRPANAAAAYHRALELDPTGESALQNLLFLRRDFMGEVGNARRLMDALQALPKVHLPDTTHLQESLFAAYDSSWSLASDALGKALALRADGFRPENTDDWLRASAVLLHLNYGAELLTFLDKRGDTARLRPWVEALRAHHVGDRRALQNVAPEIRTVAEAFYDGIARRLDKLPEKTRRRPVAKPKQARSKRRPTR